jgi:hypothetical protein
MCGDFDLELQEFKLRMMAQILNVLRLFFSESFIQNKLYNMLATMLDLCFKNMKVIRDYVGNFGANEIVANTMQRLYIHFHYMFIYI